MISVSLSVYSLTMQPPISQRNKHFFVLIYYTGITRIKKNLKKQLVVTIWEKKSLWVLISPRPTSNSNLLLEEARGLKRNSTPSRTSQNTMSIWLACRRCHNQGDLSDQQQQRKSVGIDTEKNLMPQVLGSPSQCNALLISSKP